MPLNWRVPAGRVSQWALTSSRQAALRRIPWVRPPARCGWRYAALCPTPVPGTTRRSSRQRPLPRVKPDPDPDRVRLRTIASCMAGGAGRPQRVPSCARGRKIAFRPSPSLPRIVPSIATACAWPRPRVGAGRPLPPRRGQRSFRWSRRYRRTARSLAFAAARADKGGSGSATPAAKRAAGCNRFTRSADDVCDAAVRAELVAWRVIGRAFGTLHGKLAAHPISKCQRSRHAPRW